MVPSRILSDNGLGLISNNGSSIISDNGLGLVSNNGAGIISDNGLGVIANGGGSLINKANYHTLATNSTLRAALLYLTDPDERFYKDLDLGRAFTALTDSAGGYYFRQTDTNGFPATKEVVVNAIANGNLRLTGYMVPNAGANALTLTFGTTFGTELLRGEAEAQSRAMRSYDQAAFRRAIDLTDQAIDAGGIPAVQLVQTASGTQALTPFDFRFDHVDHLRNQVAIALSAVLNAGDATMRALSDQWKLVLGERVEAVTTLLGNGLNAGLTPPASWNADGTDGVTGNGASAYQRNVPFGLSYAVAVSSRGDVFAPVYAEAPGQAHLRWIKPDGTIAAVWTTAPLVQPTGLAIAQDPPADPADPPGALIVTDAYTGVVYRVPIVDRPTWDPLDPTQPRYPWEVVAGGADPANLAGAPVDALAANPAVVENVGQPTYADDYGYVAPDDSSPLASHWRLGEEGPRQYQAGPSAGQLVPKPARFAHLSSPYAAAVDELGNVYVALPGDHRVVMIVKQPGSYFGYHQPVDNDADGLIDRDGSGRPVLDPASATMQADALYTIMGDPTWDPGTPGWLGDYAEPGNGANGQEARLNTPVGLTFNRADGCLYVCDYLNGRVRKISRDTGAVTLVAGDPAGSANDGVVALSANLGKPQGVAFDGRGRMLVVSPEETRLRMVSGGVVTTVAGRLSDGLTDRFEDGHAKRIDLYDMQSVAVDPQGNVLFTETRHRRLRKLWLQWD
jgi:hypothetical protein